MAISTFERLASVAEMAVEMDRRGAIIEALENTQSGLYQDIARVTADRDAWKSDALSLQAQLKIHIERGDRLATALTAAMNDEPGWYDLARGARS